MVGFVNALAILIFMAQVPALHRRPVAGLPAGRRRARCHRGPAAAHQVVPAPLVAIVALTADHRRWPRIAVPDRRRQGRAAGQPAVACSARRAVHAGDPAASSRRTPSRWRCVGLLESLMTAKLVDDITDTRSDKTREAWGQGVANVVTGFFGGMGGCAMIGQTMINVKASGARTRISTFLAGVFLLVLCVGFGDVVAAHPDGRPRRRDDHGLGRHLRLAQHPARDAAADAESARPSSWSSTVVVTVATHNLAIGVGVGVLVAMVLFARRVAHFARRVDGRRRPRTARHGRLRASPASCSSPPPTTSTRQFDYARDPDHVVIDLSAVPHLGRLHGRRPGRDHHQVRAQGQDRRDHRPQRRQRRAPRAALGVAARALSRTGALRQSCFGRRRLQASRRE